MTCAVAEIFDSDFDADEIDSGYHCDCCSGVRSGRHHVLPARLGLGECRLESTYERSSVFVEPDWVVCVQAAQPVLVRRREECFQLHFGEEKAGIVDLPFLAEEAASAKEERKHHMLAGLYQHY